MKVKQLVVPQEKCEEELAAFKSLIRSNRKTVLQTVHRDLHRVYGHIQKGGSVIDVHTSFKKAGVNDDLDPRLAICRADAKTCFCYKDPYGSAVYSINSRITTPRKSNGDTFLPAETFNFLEEGKTWIPWEKRFIQTPVPIVPASILAPIQHSLKNYHVIWEVEKWQPIPPKDPILVKIVTPNIALVLATWNLTPLERAVIRGRIE